MLTKFWEGVGESLAEKWLSLIGPALVFWAGGIYFWVGWDELKNLSKDLVALDVIQQIALLVGLFLLLSASATLIQRLSFPLLRLLEGYWAFPFHWLAVLLTKWQKFWIKRLEKRWQRLIKKRSESDLSLLEKRRYADVERKLHYTPTDPKNIMPTKLGNILRMAETQPRHKYGLDAVVCWPRLWLLLPDSIQEQLSQSRQTLNGSVELWAWGILFTLWSFKTWWALPIGLLWAWIAYQLALNSAMTYADLIEATFDTHRWALYRSLHLDLPENAKDEPELGKKVTGYLWRGITAGTIEFKHPEKK